MEDNQSCQIDLSFNSRYKGEWRILTYIAFQKDGTSTFKNIIKNTGIPERSAWRYLHNLQERNLLEVHRGKETSVSFVDQDTWTKVKEGMQVINQYLSYYYKDKS